MGPTTKTRDNKKGVLTYDNYNDKKGFNKEFRGG